MGSHPLPTERKALWRRASGLLVLCLVLAAAASSDALHDALVAVMAASEELIAAHPVAGATLFVVFAAISAMLAFVSVAVIVPVAVYTWGQPLSILLLWLGWILGGLLAYATARFLGRSVVRWLTQETGLKRLESYVRPDTPFTLVLLFQLALPSEIPGYVLGLARYPLARYILALAVAELPFAVATVNLGASFLERRSLLVLGFGVALVLLSAVAFTRLRKRLAQVDRAAGRTQRPHSQANESST